MRKNIYYIKLKDECEETNNIIVVETKRSFESVKAIIENAIKSFYKGSAKVCDNIWEYINYSLDRNHIKWNDLQLNSTIYY
jgi:hypothetical protein